MKHSLSHIESFSLFGKDVPTVISCYDQSNEFKQIRYCYNINLCQLMMGFQDNVQRIIRNQKKYLETHPIK